MADRHYRKPGWLTQHVFNRVVALTTRAGISVLGSRVLEVRGRKTRPGPQDAGQPALAGRAPVPRLAAR